jgi:hypothetical protein
MKKKISQKFLILSISLLLISGGVVAFACAGGDDFFPDFVNSFFAPEVSHSEATKPFYRSVNTFYSEEWYWDTKNVMDSANLKDWFSFFNKKVSVDDIKYLVYKSRIGEIDTCIFFIKNNKYPITDFLRKNSLLSIEDKSLAKEFLFYLGYAKRCEPYSTFVSGWWNDNDEDPRTNKEAMDKLVASGKKVMPTVNSLFIKERYSFQIIRLLFQSGLYDECISFYDDIKDFKFSNTTLQYRIMGYVAAAHYKQKDYTHANYMYSIIFDKCDDMKKIAFLSFHPQDEEDWEGSLKLANNNHEKIVLWHLLGIYADPLRAMKEIYKLDSKSDALDLLLTRAVNINEEAFIPELSDYDKDSTYELKKQNVDKDLLSFCEELAASNNTSKPYLWNLASGYLNLATSNFKKSEKYLNAAISREKEDALVEEQVHALSLISRVELYSKPDIRKEKELTEELEWISGNNHQQALRNSNIYNWALKRLAVKYQSWGDSVKAQCLNYRLNPNFYYNGNNMEALIKYMDKKDKTEFDNFIIPIHPYSKAELFTYKAIQLIYDYKFKEALATLDSCEGTGNGVLPADPFIIHINDCHDCDFRASKETEYDQYSFVKTLIDLQNKTATDTKNASNYYYLLATGLYNMTFYGNSHCVFDSPLIDLSIYSFEYGYNTEKKVKYSKFLDCSKAMEYFNKASALSKDNEFKAKCCFMSAKCEQNNYFSSEDFSYDHFIQSGDFYKLFSDYYSKTKYYNEVIKECGFFKKYADNSNK